MCDGVQADDCEQRDRDNAFRLLRHFGDTRLARYSVQSIAQMGAAEGKQVGQWFGPNTVAQVCETMLRR